MKGSSDIDVDTEDGLPRLVNWRGQTYSVLRINKHWVEKRSFWRSDRQFYHVETNGGTLEIVHDGRQWRFCGVLDSEEWVDSDVESEPRSRARDDDRSA